MTKFLVDKEAGKLLLQQLIPVSQKEIENNPQMHTEAMSSLGRNTSAFVTMENLESIVIYQAPLGGWHADVLLKNVPPGIPNVMGSPVAAPFKTKEQAFEGAQHILTAVLLLMKYEKPKEVNPTFHFFDYVFTLNQEIFNNLREKGLSSEKFMKSSCIDMMDDFMSTFFPNGYKNDYDKWDSKIKQLFLTIIHMNVFAGNYHYPPRQHGLPTDNPLEKIMD